MSVSNRIRRVGQKIKIARKLGKNRLSAGYGTGVYGRLSTEEVERIGQIYEMHQDGRRYPKLGPYEAASRGARIVAESFAKNRRNAQKSINRQRGPVKNSPYKLTGLGKTPEWEARQAAGAKVFEERLKSDPAFRERIQRMLQESDRKIVEKRAKREHR
ncbi:MAG: hypothetical protein AABW68_00200 [archaeon]